MSNSNENKKEKIEMDLSKLPAKEAKILLSALMAFSEHPSVSSVAKVFAALYRLSDKLDLHPSYSMVNRLAKKRPPDEPRRRRRR